MPPRSPTRPGRRYNWYRICAAGRDTCRRRALARYFRTPQNKTTNISGHVAA